MSLSLTQGISGRPADFGYPALAYFAILKHGQVEFHEIWFAGAPGALFNNAPNGSKLIDTATGNIHVKDGTIGASDGTFKLHTAV